MEDPVPISSGWYWRWPHTGPICERGAAGIAVPLGYRYSRTGTELHIDDATRTTQLGDLDLLGEVTGGGRYSDLMPLTQEVELGTNTYRVVTLVKLIQLKRAAGRPKDLEAIAELDALREENR
jgi:hypothetical protein